MNQLDWPIIIIIVWDLVWKAIALWKSARLNHKYFFIILLVINSVGIVPIGYLLYLKYFYKKTAALPTTTPKKKSKTSKKS